MEPSTAPTLTDLLDQAKRCLQRALRRNEADSAKHYATTVGILCDKLRQATRPRRGASPVTRTYRLIVRFQDGDGEEKEASHTFPEGTPRAEAWRAGEAAYAVRSGTRTVELLTFRSDSNRMNTPEWIPRPAKACPCQ